MPIRRPRQFATAALAVVGLIAALLPTSPAAAAEVYDEVVEIVFPTIPSASFGNDYDAPRGGGTRVHRATDVIAPKHSPAYAAVDGVICGLTSPQTSWGMAITLCGDNGITFDYLHMNNDTPGTDDGRGGYEHAYAPGIRVGVRVAAGQLIGWVGDSGNAEHTVPHIHFEMEDNRVTDPYGSSRMNPYASLAAAHAAGRFSDGTAVATDPATRISGGDRVGTALALAGEGWDRAATVVLARADLPWPAIVAGPLAAVHEAPVLTTAADELDDRVRARIAALGAERVLVVGPVDFDLAAALEGMAVTEAVVLDGGDRYATAALVARQVWDATGAGGQAPTEPLDGVALAWEGSLLDLDQAIFDLHDGWVEVADLQPGLAATVHQLQAEGPLLVATDNPDRLGGVHLEGATVAAPFAAQVVGLDPRDVDRVDFFLDDPDLSRRRSQRERFHPYDAAGSDDAGASLFTPEEWGPGEHVLSAQVQYADGRIQDLQARFRVVTAGMPRQAVLALGDHPDPARSWPDALMASYYGSTRSIPVLLTEPSGLDAATGDALAEVETTWVIGGRAAISEAITSAMATGSGTDVRRLSGPNRYATALAVVEDLLDRGMVDPARVWVATGRNWPDATASGPTVSRARDVLVLVDGQAGGADADTRAWLAQRAEHVESVTALGGTAAVAVDALRAAAIAIT